MTRVANQIALIACGVAVGSAAAGAQSSPGDSARTDTNPPRTVSGHPVHDPRMFAAAILAPFVIAGAPALAIFVGERGPTEIGFLADHQSLQLSAGGRFELGQTWTNAAEIEVVQRDIHTELIAEDFWGAHHLRYLTARVGPLWHPRRYTAGGVTLGYGHVDGDGEQGGLEVGLPLVAGGPTTLMRLEPTYIIAPIGLLWSYRLQVEAAIPGGPFVAGANMAWKADPLTSNVRRSFAAAPSGRSE